MLGLIDGLYCCSHPLVHTIIEPTPGFAGFMSNRGRQNVASYLVLDLGVDWRRGADYFENVLLDYDVSASDCFDPGGGQGGRREGTTSETSCRAVA